MSSSASYFLEDRSQPLVNNNPASLNDRLYTQYVDVPEEDQSCHAQLVRSMANFVGAILTPKKVLAILRVLKAMSLCFIVLTILANIMYIVFVEVFANKEVKQMAGGGRDIFIRVYGLILSFIALAIEVDYTKIVKRYSGLKAFIPRALLYLFIAIITASHPQSQDVEYYSQQNNNNNYNNNNYGGVDDDAYNYGDDDANQQYDDAYQQQQQDDNFFDNYESTKAEIPSSAVTFQIFSSFILGCCAIAYLICGILCFDRFTALAFISTKDPRVTTAIPSAMDTSMQRSQMTQSTGASGAYA